MGTLSAVELKDRLRALRKKIGITQEALAAKGGLDRVEVSNLESGRNQATSVRILRGLAIGFGLSLQDTADFIDGQLDVETALGRVGRPPLPRAARETAAALAREIGVSEVRVRNRLRFAHPSQRQPHAPQPPSPRRARRARTERPRQRSRA